MDPGRRILALQSWVQHSESRIQNHTEAPGKRGRAWHPREVTKQDEGLEVEGADVDANSGDLCEL